MYRDDELAARLLREGADADVARNVPALSELRIANPCDQAWDDMRGDERVRHCGRCDKEVFNFRALTRVEIQSLLISRGAELCAQLYRRTDGTLMTADCVDVQRLRRRRKAVAAVAAVAMAVPFVAIALTDAEVAAAPEAPEATWDRPSTPLPPPRPMEEDTWVLSGGDLIVELPPPVPTVPAAPRATDGDEAPALADHVSTVFSGDPRSR